MVDGKGSYEGGQDSLSAAAPPDACGPDVRCQRCGVEVPPTNNCRICGAFLPSNEAGLRHGLRRYQNNKVLPAELEAYIVNFRAELIADQGGEEEMTAVRRGLVEKLVDLEVGVRLLMAEVVSRGIDSRPGKAAWTQALRTVETWHRVGNTLGLDRRARPVQTLAEVMADE